MFVDCKHGCECVRDYIMGKAQTRTTKTPDKDSADAETSAARAVADLQVAGPQSSLRRMMGTCESSRPHSLTSRSSVCGNASNQAGDLGKLTILNQY